MLIVCVCVVMLPHAAPAAIVYVRETAKGERHLFQIDPTPSARGRQLTKNDDPVALVYYNMFPAVSRDGRYVAFSTFRIYPDEGLKQWKQWNGNALYPSREFFLYFYSYFPTRTYFTRHKSLNWAVHLLDLKNGKETKLSNFLWDELEPQFMPKGGEVLYTLTAEQSVFVLKGDKSGKSFKQYTLADSQAVHPQVSADGRQIVYQSFRHGSWDIYTMPLAELMRDRPETRLTATSNADEVMPRWIPDGKRVIFASNGVDRRFFDLAVMEVSTGNRRFITRKASIGPDFTVSPDGRAVAYTADRRGGRGLYIVYLNGTAKPIEVKGWKGKSAYNPVWSPDSRSVAFLAGSPKELMLYVTDTNGVAKKIGNEKCAMSTLAWY